MERVIAYIDGFNLYFGLKANGWRNYYWLNIKSLCEKLMDSDQQLVRTKYFTSRIKNDLEKEKRQSAYLDALGTITELDIRYGRYKTNSRTCRFCHQVDEVPTEKMTDVRIASEMIADAIQDKYDTALLITGDGDLVPAIEVIRDVSPNKKIIIGIPPQRYNAALIGISNGYRRIFKNYIRDSILPDPITMPSGYVLNCPEYWKK